MQLALGRSAAGRKRQGTTLVALAGWTLASWTSTARPQTHGRGRLALVSRGSPITVCRIPARRTRTSPLLPSNRLCDFRDRPGYTSLRGHG